MLYEGMSRNGLPVELQVFYGFLFINNHAQGCDADFNMLLYIILGPVSYTHLTLPTKLEV